MSVSVSACVGGVGRGGRGSVSVCVGGWGGRREEMWQGNGHGYKLTSA